MTGQNKPRRPRPRKPVTAERVEEALDKLAWVMSRSRNAALGVPLWKRLQDELARLKDEEAVIAEARQRLTRSPDRTEARSA